MKIAMVGSGYVGLVSGACFADFGHEVVCIDKDQGKIDRLHDGIMPIFEPGLAELVGTNVKAGRLSFTTDLAAGIDGAQAIFIAVGTPSRRGDGHADLSFVYAVAKEVGAESGERRGRRDQIHRSGRHRGRGGTHFDRQRHRASISPSSPTPNSCAKGRRSAISNAPTGSLSGRKTISGAT